MDNFEDRFNDILVQAYHNVLELEEVTRRNGKMDISFRDRNMLEYLYMAEDRSRTMGEIAKFLKITKPSATATIRRLERKRCVTREGSPEDGRLVRIRLTRKGELLNVYHHMFRTNMVEEASSEFTHSEKEALYRGMYLLNQFFERNIEKTRDSKQRKAAKFALLMNGKVREEKEEE